MLTMSSVGVGGAMGDATKVDMSAWERDLRINLTSMVLMARHCIPEMRKHGRGAIVNMSSVSGCRSQVLERTLSLQPADEVLTRISTGRESELTVSDNKRCYHSNDSRDGCAAWP